MALKEKPIEFYIDENGCHICTSHKQKRLKNGKQVHIHHYVYRTQVGEVPEGMIVTRKCGNKRCINLDHLILITKAEDAALRSKKYVAHPIDFEVDPVTGCFNCTSHHKNSSGYPQIQVDNEEYPVHRFVYEQMFGEIPEGLEVRHHCDNPLCCNPEHLELGTHYDNMQDKVKRGRCARMKGSTNGNSKLTEDIVREIKQRLKAGDSLSCLAKVYGVKKVTISDIKRGKTWKHVTID